MEDVIKQIVGSREISQIKELNLSKCKSKNITGLSEDYKNLELLDVDNVGISSLKSFPRLVNLKTLVLTNNELSEGLDALACLPKLTAVNLSGNKIKDLDVLQPLSEISTLTNLQLKGCDITDMEDYRQKIFELIPTLKSLDGVMKGSEASIEDDEDEEVIEDEELGDDDTDEEDSLDEEVEEEEEGEVVPLSAIYNKSLNEEDDEDEEEDEDFDGEVGEEEDLDEEEEGEEDVAVANLSVEKVDSKTRGKKRKADEKSSEETESKNKK